MSELEVFYVKITIIISVVVILAWLFMPDSILIDPNNHDAEITNPLIIRAMLAGVVGLLVAFFIALAKENS